MLTNSPASGGNWRMPQVLVLSAYFLYNRNIWRLIGRKFTRSTKGSGSPSKTTSRPLLQVAKRQKKLGIGRKRKVTKSRYFLTCPRDFPRTSALDYEVQIQEIWAGPLAARHPY